MERYGSITTPVSIPRFIIGGMLVGGVAVVAMAFLNYGLLAGTVVAAIPAALCILWVTLRNPALAMLGLFVINYFIMGLTRYAHDLPFGMILDALIFYNILIISLQAMMHRIEWKRASSGLTVVAAIWVAYCVLEVVNPEIHYTTYGTKNEEGSGLGLQLVQDLTRRNGSELTIESAEGEGSTFTFTIAKEQPRSETVEDTSGGIARP